MSNPNRLIWVSDQHVVSNDSEAGIVGDTKPFEAAAFVSHIRGLEPYGFFDTGDCKDHYGLTGTTDEHDNYITYFRNRIPWLAVNAARPGETVNATKPILPGNHDELTDYLTPGGVTDFSPFDAKFWGAPYHWTADWTPAQIRIIAVHSYIAHHGDPFVSLGTVDTAEITWLSAELAALPVGWKAIVVAHMPFLTTFGNNVHYNQSALLAVLAANNTKIAACLSGHRHLNMDNAVQDGIRHITGVSTAYTVSNALGVFAIIDYDSGAGTLTFHAHFGPGSTSLFGALPPSLYTPVVVTL